MARKIKGNNSVYPPVRSRRYRARKNLVDKNQSTLYNLEQKDINIKRTREKLSRIQEFKHDIKPNDAISRGNFLHKSGAVVGKQYGPVPSTGRHWYIIELPDGNHELHMAPNSAPGNPEEWEWIISHMYM